MAALARLQSVGPATASQRRGATGARRTGVPTARRAALTARASTAGAAARTSDAYARLKGVEVRVPPWRGGRPVASSRVCGSLPQACGGTREPAAPTRAQVTRCSDGARLDIPSLWGPGERAVVVWARTFGCPFCWELAIQLRRDVKPLLDQQGVKLFLVASAWARTPRVCVRVCVCAYENAHTLVHARSVQLPPAPSPGRPRGLLPTPQPTPLPDRISRHARAVKGFRGGDRLPAGLPAGGPRQRHLRGAGAGQGRAADVLLRGGERGPPGRGCAVRGPLHAAACATCGG